MTSRMTPLLERNEQFARIFSPVPRGLPAAQVIGVACLDQGPASSPTQASGARPPR